MEEQRKIFTLTELGKSLRSVIERTYTSTYWIKAEIAKLNYYPRSGHCYPELVDKSGNVVQAQMRATIWAADYKLINRQFTEITGEPIKEGMSILFRASVTYHPLYGLSLQIWEVEPAFTLGEMALEKSRTIEKLKKEGVFSQNKTLPIPLLPKRLAIISVETSKGYHDFLQIMNEQGKNYGWWHYLFPSILQGEKAVEGIISQLRLIKKAGKSFDLVAIVRGGGGDIGLSCYDDYHLAREIATFPLPVITGIGHSTNETIVEMAAWANKITPTDVAYFVVDSFRLFGQRIEKASRSVLGKTSEIVNLNRQGIVHLAQRLERIPQAFFSQRHQKISLLTSSLLTGTNRAANQQNNFLSSIAHRLTTTAPRLIAGRSCTLDIKQLHLEKAAKSMLIYSNNHLATSETKILLLDPAQVLKRGYSITFLNGKSVKSSTELQPGNIITSLFSDGEITSTVNNTGD